MDGRLTRSYEWGERSQKTFVYFVTPNHALPPMRPELTLIHRSIEKTATPGHPPSPFSNFK
ncbi:MAG: hypothetical protein OEW84_04545 [Aigarchaeota archaeon]|nr:hypothetical protein [Aigarchaeota archaeon]